MKAYRLKAFFFIFIFSMVYLSAARQQEILRVACVDIQLIINKISSDRLLAGILKNEKNGFLRKAEELSREIERKEEIVETERDNLPKERIILLKEEIIRLREELKSYLKEKEIYIKDRNNEISSEALRSVYNLIELTAKREGFSMVLEKNTAVIYSDNDVEITQQILDQLQEKKDKIDPR